MIFLGTDPGPSNFGFSFLSFSKNGSITIPSCGMVRATISNITDKPQKPSKSKRRKTIHVPDTPPFMDQLGLFYKDWAKALTKYTPVLLTCERYQSRGMMGKTVESVNLMNGVLSSMCYVRSIRVDLIMPATWKFQINRISNLEAMYKEISLPDHIVDSAFIALYGALKLNGIPWSSYYVDRLYTELTKLELYTGKKT